MISTYRNIKNTETTYILEKNYKSGYPIVLLTHQGISKTYKVHKLVAKIFLDNYDDKKVVNHIDGDKTNAKTEITILKKDLLKDNQKVAQIINEYNLNKKQFKK